MNSPHIIGMQCINCEMIYEDVQEFQGCSECRTSNIGSNLFPAYDYSDVNISRERVESSAGGPFALPETLPVSQEFFVSNGVGDTPMINAANYAQDWGVGNVWIKDESQNPTWSYKDRLSAVAVSKALEEDKNVITASSTGNHGASTAAYAARANLDCVIFTVPTVPETMHALMGAYGPKLIATEDLESRWTLMKACVDEYGWYPTSNFVQPPVGSNPFGIEGYKSIAYEICKDLDWEVPNWIVQPTAYGDGLVGIWRGFMELQELGLIDTLPRLLAVERFGSLRLALRNRLKHVEVVDTESTSAFSIGVHISTQQALVTLRESNGCAVVVSEDSLISGQLEIGRKLGICPEAAAATGFAAMDEYHDSGIFESEDLIVIVNTSSGLKDISPILDTVGEIPVIEPDLEALQSVCEF